MTSITAVAAASPAGAVAAIPDPAGRDRLALNVLASWGGQIVFIISGFVMPRLIDGHLGQASLGIWDFGWSTVSYFHLAQVGVGSSVNRYVAMFRATGEVDRLSRAVSSAHAIQYAACLLVLVLSAVLAWAVPERMLDAATARLVVGLLGASIAVDMVFNAYSGVLTGCHRWDLHNAVSSAFHALQVAGMIAVLQAGGGLGALAATYLTGTLLAGLARRHLAFRACPELRMSLRLATLQDARTLFVFGGKTIVDQLSHLLINQANSVLVAAHLGPAALAVYARPMALVRVAGTLTEKFGMVFTPAVASLVSRRQIPELRELFVDASRGATFVVMPITLFLVVMGGPILQLWMGPRYREGALLAVLACGHFLALAQLPTCHVLRGMNRHGAVGWASLAAAVSGVIAAMLALGPFRGGLVAAALALVVPYSIGSGLFLVVYGCRTVDVPVRTYVRHVFGVPALWLAPYAAALAVIRVAFGARPAVALGVAVAVSAAILPPLYWRVVLPASLRRRILAKLPQSLARGLEFDDAATAVADRPGLALVARADRADAGVEHRALPAVLRDMPYPYRAALAICSDLDLTPDRYAYLEAARFLNTTETTAMGSGVGLEVGNTIYFDMAPDQFAYWNTDDAGREMVRALIRSGHIDCLHSFGDLADTRAHAGRALDDLARHGCRLEVWIDHAVAPTNLGADIMRGQGDVPGSPAYHTDVTCDAGLRFVWRGRVTSVVGQNVPRRIGGIWHGSRPVGSAVTLGKEAVKGLLARTGDGKYRMHASNSLLREITLRDGRPVYEFLRANPHPGGVSCGDTAAGLADVLTERMLQRLAARRGMSIVYTHLGKAQHPLEPFDARGRQALRRLAAMQDAGVVLVTTTRRLLGYAAARQRIEGTVTTQNGCARVDLRVRPDGGRPIAREDLDGLTVYVPDVTNVRLFVDGDEIPRLQRHPADETGRPSVTIPWRRLEFPRS